MLAITATACGGAGGVMEPKTAEITFSATIGGDINAKLRGANAYYITGPGGGGIHLDSGDQSTYQILIDHTGSLSVGTRPVTDSEDGVFGALTDTQQGELRVWYFDGGTLTINSMSNDVISGSFNVTAYEAPPGTRRVTVAGSFTARIARVPAP
jgi:hypothetical protein